MAAVSMMKAYTILNPFSLFYHNVFVLQWIHNDLIKQTQSKLAPIIEGITAATSEELRAEVLSLLSQRSMSAGYYWALAKSCYETLVGRKPAAITSIADNFDVTKVDTLTGNGFFHTLQVCFIYFTYMEPHA